MKTSIKTIAAAIALTALVAGPASAMVLQGDVNSRISSVIGAGSNVTALVSGDTVTLIGYFADASDKNNAISAAMKVAGVERVITNAFPSN